MKSSTLIRVMLALALPALCGACQRSASFTVRVEGLTIPREYAASVEVTNWNGNVQIVASDRFSSPAVRAKARALNDTAPESFDDLRQTISVRAVSVEENGRRILRVTSLPFPGSNAPVAADLQIRIPRASGVTVFNSGGDVDVVGVAGAVLVQNGGPGKSGGNVEVRTGMPMTEPVTLTTSEGKILYQIGRGSTGDLDLKAAGGMPQVEAKIGTVGGITYKNDRWRGSLDGGKNPVKLESGKGDVRILVIENAGEYGKEHWDGWPSWPTSPRWIAKLAGE